MPRSGTPSGQSESSDAQSDAAAAGQGSLPSADGHDGGALAPAPGKGDDLLLTGTAAGSQAPSLLQVGDPNPGIREVHFIPQPASHGVAKKLVLKIRAELEKLSTAQGSQASFYESETDREETPAFKSLSALSVSTRPVEGYTKPQKAFNNAVQSLLNALYDDDEPLKSETAQKEQKQRLEQLHTLVTSLRTDLKLATPDLDAASLRIKRYADDSKKLAGWERYWKLISGVIVVACAVIGAVVGAVIGTAASGGSPAALVAAPLSAGLGAKIGAGVGSNVAIALAAWGTFGGAFKKQRLTDNVEQQARSLITPGNGR